MNAVARKPFVALWSGLFAVVRRIADAFATLAAATAVATAVENRRQPLPSDLAQLGMEGAKFNVNY